MEFKIIEFLGKPSYNFFKNVTLNMKSPLLPLNQGEELIFKIMMILHKQKYPPRTFEVDIKIPYRNSHEYIETNIFCGIPILYKMDTSEFGDTGTLRNYFYGTSEDFTKNLDNIVFQTYSHNLEGIYDKLGYNIHDLAINTKNISSELITEIQTKLQDPSKNEIQKKIMCSQMLDKIPKIWLNRTQSCYKKCHICLKNIAEVKQRIIRHKKTYWNHCNSYEHMEMSEKSYLHKKFFVYIKIYAYGT